MKKLTTLLLALFVTTGMALAQSNEADVTQTGSNSTADVDQTNSGTVDQENYAKVTSSDGDNVVDIEQVIAAGSTKDTKDNTAYVMTSGGNSTVNITQLNNGVVFGNQSGNAFIADVNQSGGSNEADIYQRGNGLTQAEVTQTLGSAFADVDQIHGDGGKPVEAYVDQSGNNFAEVYQKNRNLRVVLNQTNTAGATGVLNQAFVSQGFNAGKVVGADAFVDQTGQNNFVDLDQDRLSDPFSHYADLDQNGDNNSIRLQQDGDSEATVLQEGDGNLFEGLTSGNQALQEAESDINAFTYGNDNVIQIGQGVGNTANIFQGLVGTPSNNNTAIVDQSIATNSTVNVNQQN